MKYRKRADDMKLITQLIAILIVMKIVVSDLLKCFKERKKIMSLFKVSVISCLYITSAKKRLEEFSRKPPKFDKGRSFIHGIILTPKPRDEMKDASKRDFWTVPRFSLTVYMTI